MLVDLSQTGGADRLFYNRATQSCRTVTWIDESHVLASCNDLEAGTLALVPGRPDFVRIDVRVPGTPGEPVLEGGDAWPDYYGVPTGAGGSSP